MDPTHRCRRLFSVIIGGSPSGTLLCSISLVSCRLFYSLYHTRYLRGGSWAARALVGPSPVKLSYAAVPTWVNPVSAMLFFSY